MRRAQERMLKSLGLDIEEIGQAEEVVIKLENRIITIKGPSVLLVKTGGEKVFQLVGGELLEQAKVEQPPSYVPSEDDVMLVVAQTGVSEEEARGALMQTSGDLAKAILMLRSKR